VLSAGAFFKEEVATAIMFDRSYTELLSCLPAFQTLPEQQG
jgi:hypothetical protein